MSQCNFIQSSKALVFIVSLLVFPLAVSSQQAAQDAEPQTEQAMAQEAESAAEEVPSGASITVYVDAKFGRRTKGAAKAITKSHKKYEQQGFRFSDLELYTENGDLEGFFVTYTKN